MIIKKLLRSKSLILSIVIVFSLIIIGLIIQVIFLYRDIRSSSLNSSNNIYNKHHHHNHKNYHYHSHLKNIDNNNNNQKEEEEEEEEENINVEKVRDKSHESLRHRIQEKRKNLKLNETINDNDVNINETYNFTIRSSRLRKNDHTKLLKSHVIAKPKHYKHNNNNNHKSDNFIIWYITSLIQIFMSLIKFLYSTITIFSLKTINEEQSISYYNDNIQVPYIIQLWRQAKLDWHTLIPKHDSSYERYYNDKNENNKDLQLRVLKERSITDYLTQYHESGLSAKYGHDHGKLNKYYSCDILSSGCTIHDQKECINNQLCYWDNEADICNEVDDTHSSINSAECTYPKIFSSNGTIMNANHSQCITYTNQKAVVTILESETQLMFYHWWAVWAEIMNNWHSDYLDNRKIHYFIKDIVDPMFFSYFGFISDFCWRRLKNQVPKGVCFCDVTELKPHQSRIEFPKAADYIINYFNLQDIRPPENKAKIGIVSRRRKRFILNEYQLVKICSDMGIICELLPLESMTIYEQIRAFRTLDVLIGIHGSALDNVGFLQEGSVLVQLLPYKVKYRATFKATALKAGIKYMEWKATNPKLSVFHWDLLEEASPRKLTEYTHDEILEEGQETSGQRETLMFWINQDIIVPENEWKELLKQAISESPANETRKIILK